jgi:hypothetical protein
MPLTIDATTFPDIIGQAYSKQLVFTSVSTGITSGKDQDITITEPVYTFRLGWTALSRTQAALLTESFRTCGGQWGEVWFREWRQGRHLVTFTGTDSEEYMIPATDVTDLTATVDGVLTSCMLVHEAGQGGATLAAFGNVVPEGAEIVFDFVGRRIRRVRFSNVDLGLTDRSNDSNVWQGSVVLLEVSADSRPGFTS